MGRGPDSAGYVFWENCEGRGIGCGLLQMFLLAAVMNGLGPERWGMG